MVIIAQGEFFPRINWRLVWPILIPISPVFQGVLSLSQLAWSCQRQFRYRWLVASANLIFIVHTWRLFLFADGSSEWNFTVFFLTLSSAAAVLAKRFSPIRFCWRSVSTGLAVAASGVTVHSLIVPPALVWSMPEAQFLSPNGQYEAVLYRYPWYEESTVTIRPARLSRSEWWAYPEEEVSDAICEDSNDAAWKGNEVFEIEMLGVGDQAMLKPRWRNVRVRVDWE